MSDVTPDDVNGVGAEVPVEEAQELVTVSGVAAEASGVLTFSPLDASLTGEAREDAVRQLLKATSTAGTKIELVQGEGLYECFKNGYWKHWEDDDGNKYTSFEKYVQEELGVKPKTASNRRNMYEALVVRAKLTAADLQDVNLSFVPFIAQYITEQTAPALLDAMKKLKFRDMPGFAENLKSSPSVEDAVTASITAQAARLSGKTASDGTVDTSAAAPAAAPANSAKEASEGVKTLTMKMPAEQYKVVIEAIAAAKAATATDSDNQALENICLSFMSSCPPTTMSDADKLATVTTLCLSIESVYGIQIKPVG